MSNDSEMKVLTSSKCCFCLISVARKVTSTPPVNKSSTFQSLGQATERDVSQTTNTRWREVPRCVGHDTAVLSRVTRRFPINRSRTSQSARKTQTRIRNAKSARILELQIEIDKLEFLADFTKRERCEITRRAPPKDDVCVDAR